MFFSIIIPLYNRPQEIDELLSTLCKQSYTRFEVLVIEDGSVKDAADIVTAYANRLDIKYYVKPNSGQGFSRNYGFERAKGDYFIIFDSDVLVPEDYLEIVKNYLYEHKLDSYGGPDAVHPDFTPIQKAINYAMTSPFTTGGIRGNKKHIGRFHPRSFNMGLSRQVYQKTGGFILTRLGEDIEYSIRIGNNGFKTGLIPEAKIYHKRRTGFCRFYKQLHLFGRARINIYKHFPKELKLVHFFPAIFALALGFTLVVNFVYAPLALVCNLLLLLYLLLIFFHALAVNKSIKIAFLSIIASLIQLIAYGFGFIQDFAKRIIFDSR